MVQRADLRGRAQRLRREQTPAEALLWKELRGRRFAGFKFRRQFPVAGYIGDFCCVEKRLVVEIDGGQHLGQKRYDRERTKRLEECGYRIVRFWNTEVVEKIDEVLEEIFRRLE